MNVAYQGLPGAYSEGAVLQYHGSSADPVPCPYIEDVFDAVEQGRADSGLIPVENTIEGTITRSYDLLNERSLKIQGETVYRVVHCLIANPGVKPGDIKKVYSHPQALGQTREYLQQHSYEPVNFFDTAGSVKMLHDERRMDAAAVASRRAADLYGLSVIAESIETNKENYTRFLSIGHGGPEPTGRDKTSLSLIIAHRPGSLLAALKALSDRRLNLTKIESRPLVGKPFEYVFFIDFYGHKDDAVTAEALRDLKALSAAVRILGSYPRA